MQALGNHPCVTLLNIMLENTEKGQLVLRTLFGYKHHVLSSFCSQFQYKSCYFNINLASWELFIFFLVWFVY